MRYTGTMLLRVRDLTLEEGQKLRHTVLHGQNAIEFERARSVLASYQGNTPPRIALITLASEDYIRGVVRAFNERGTTMLPPKWGPGRPPKFTDDQRKALVLLALSRPRDLGLPYAQWGDHTFRPMGRQREVGRHTPLWVRLGIPGRSGQRQRARRAKR